MSDSKIHNRISKLERAITQIEADLRQLKLTVGKPRQEDEAAVRKTEDPDQKNNSAPISFEGTVTDAKNPHNGPQQTIPLNKRIWKVIIRVFRKDHLEYAGILFAIGYAVITYLQWHDLRHNFSVDERAWIKAEVTLPSSLDSNAVATIKFSNVGKSPALRMHGGVDVQLVDEDKPPSYVVGTQIRQMAVNMLFPTDFSTFSSGRTPNNSDGTPRPFTAEELQRLASGRAYLAAFGLIAYADQFGSHWTRFCAWKGYQVGYKDYSASGCTLWNTVGDGPVKWSGPEQQ